MSDGVKMSNNLLDEVKEFLKNARLTNYEIKIYMTLLQTNNLNARDLSRKSGVPVGRIYDVLFELQEKGLIEIQDSRPKIYKAVSPNLAFRNVIYHLNNQTKREISFLTDQAKDLEFKLQDFKSSSGDSSRTFWSTTFGARDSLELYAKKFRELQDELLMTGFINENTIKVIPYARNFYAELLRAVERGIETKFLWSFEFDGRPLNDGLIKRNLTLYDELIKKFKELFNISSKMKGLEMKYMHKKIPTYYDVFDSKRVIIKLQNPMDSSRIYACMNVLDPELATELRKKYLALWQFEASY